MQARHGECEALEEIELEDVEQLDELHVRWRPRNGKHHGERGVDLQVAHQNAELPAGKPPPGLPREAEGEARCGGARRRDARAVHRERRSGTLGRQLVFTDRVAQRTVRGFLRSLARLEQRVLGSALRRVGAHRCANNGRCVTCRARRGGGAAQRHDRVQLTLVDELQVARAVVPRNRGSRRCALALVQPPQRPLAQAPHRDADAHGGHKGVDLERRYGAHCDREREREERGGAEGQGEDLVRPQHVERRGALLAATVDGGHVGDVALYARRAERARGVERAREHGGVGHTARQRVEALEHRRAPGEGVRC